MSGGMHILGYSPFDAPSTGSPIYPFNEIFDQACSLYTLKDFNVVDAVLLWGGADISPSFYGDWFLPGSGPQVPTQRDMFEWQVLRQAHERKLPIIGVCRGAQMICAYAGGKLVQDVTGHQGEHSIHTSDNTFFNVSSSHHQMLYPYDVEHELLAWTPVRKSIRYLGIEVERAAKFESYQVKEPEVVYFPEINAMAIQCHPEWHQKDHPFNKWILEMIVEKCFSKLTA